jgi:glycosyltransferase involved in cell wall biosynthesis
VFTSSSARDPTSANLAFVTVEPVTRGRGRVRYALECWSFAGRATKALARRRGEFDVVQVEGYAAYGADLVTVHAVRAAEVEHYFGRVEPEAGALRRRATRVTRRLLAGPAWPYCICPSRAVQGDLERWHGVPTDRIKVLPYGVEVQRFRRDPDAGARLRAELGTPPDRLVLLFIGTSFERKGFDACLAGLARSGLADAELWAIGGTHAEQLRAEKAVRRSGLAGQVRLLGWRPFSELPAFYSAADVFVLPTKQDSWAIPVTEALAAGCVVVTSEYAGSCELIASGVSGYVLAEQGHPEELAALLKGPLLDPSTRAGLASRGLEAIVRYDFEAVYAEYRAALWHAYELACERPGSAPSLALPPQVVGYG